MGIKENRAEGKNNEKWSSEMRSWFRSEKDTKRSDKEGGADWKTESY